jgi:hypothetical protein
MTLLTDEHKRPVELFARGMIERAAGGDGYDVMEAAGTGPRVDRWHAVPSWGLDGWDLGSWPLVAVYVRRDTNGEHQLAYYVEGDVTIYGYATVEERNRAIDELAFFHWNWAGESWVEGIDSADEMPNHLCGPFSWDRLNTAKEAAEKAIAYLRENDCDFLTVENVCDYGQVDSYSAERALRDVMGNEWFDQKAEVQR